METLFLKIAITTLIQRVKPTFVWGLGVGMIAKL